MSTAHLVIGASGAIGQAVTALLSEQKDGLSIYAISRGAISQNLPNVISVTLDSSDENDISAWLSARKSEGIRFKTVVCTVGILHGDIAGVTLQPEKKLEDISAVSLSQYFAVNTIIPALWLKALVGCMADEGSAIACLSARVGSIEDNRLGGWYGYRASKSALNMIVKTAAVEYGRRSKNTVLISYHPGTVDSELSAPFQKNVPEGKLFTAGFTARRLLDYIQKADVNGHPHYIDWDHKNIPW